eukprot:1938633-Ditylum_brightwellii.AAC.1
MHCHICAVICIYVALLALCSLLFCTAVSSSHKVPDVRDEVVKLGEARLNAKVEYFYSALKHC